MSLYLTACPTPGTIYNICAMAGNKNAEHVLRKDQLLQ